MSEEPTQQKSEAHEKAQETKKAYEEAEAKMREWEERDPEDLPSDLSEWPDDQAKYSTFGGAEGEHGYDEGPETKLGPSEVVHQPDGGERPHPTSALPPEPSDFVSMELAGLTVLVVDDQPDARELILRVLEDCSARVLTAGSAEEAVPLVESGRPDVLITDIGMPGADGYELLRRVRELGPARGGRVPAIALTAFARSEDRTRALRSGFMVHVSKPVDPSELVATVAAVAGRVSPSGETGASAN